MKKLFPLPFSKRWAVICLGLMSMFAFIGNGTAFASSAKPMKQPQVTGYHLVHVMRGPNIPVAGPFWAFDIGWVDASHHRYYLADGGNKRVDIFDTTRMTFLGSIKGFTGFDGQFGDFATMGPSGVVGDGHGHLFVSDGNSTLKIIDLDRTGTYAERITSINTGGSKRVDEMAYTPAVGGLIVAANSGDAPPFVSLISVHLHRVLAQRTFSEATAGIEQPVIDQQLGLIFLTIPATVDHPGGEVDVLSPTLSLLHRFALANCQPNGEALDSKTQILALGCAVGHPLLLNVLSGHIAAIPQIADAGIDVVAFNSRDARFYFAAAFGSGGPIVGVVQATGQWLTAIPTGPFAHSVSVDERTNQIFVPMAGPGGGVGVFQEDGKG